MPRGKANVPRSFTKNQATARQRRVIELMANGKTAAEIAELMGPVSVSAIRKMQKRALANQAAEMANREYWQAAHVLQTMQYQALLARWLPRAVSASFDDKAAEIALKIMNQYDGISGFKTVRLETSSSDGGTGEISVPLTQAQIAGVMSRLDGLADRFTMAEVIDGETVDGPGDTEQDHSSNPASSDTTTSK